MKISSRAPERTAAQPCSAAAVSAARPTKTGFALPAALRRKRWSIPHPHLPTLTPVGGTVDSQNWPGAHEDAVPGLVMPRAEPALSVGSVPAAGCPLPTGPDTEDTDDIDDRTARPHQRPGDQPR